MGGRSGSSGFRAGGNNPQTASVQISDYYQARLAQIDAEIRRQQVVASMSQNSAITRRKVQQARKRITQLSEQYDQIERIAREDALSGIGF